jgi:putative ABC transport system permease protein
MIYLRIIGLLRDRLMRLVRAGFGIVVTVALLASLGAFLVTSTTTMPERATSAVPIDWQVEAVPGSDAEAIDAAIRKASPVKALEQVLYAGTDAF